MNKEKFTKSLFGGSGGSKGSVWFNDFWLAPREQRYWQNREAANIGLTDIFR